MGRPLSTMALARRYGWGSGFGGGVLGGFCWGVGMISVFFLGVCFNNVFFCLEIVLLFLFSCFIG